VLSRHRVRVGWLLGLVAVALARPTPRSLLLGGLVALAGEVVRLWASGHIEKTERLATGGPYAHTRNPLYVGSLLIAFAFAVAGNSLAVALLVAAYFAVFYPAVMREESAFLRARFSELYGRWAQDVPAFLPRLTPGGPRETRFSWSRVRRNREWRTALALPLIVALLWARGVLLP
jgi:protein-S-isoprenylcysteine O-methyltransferase Ste14